MDVMDMFMAYIVAMISQIDTYIQTQQVVCIKYAKLLVCDSYLIKDVKKKCKEARLFHHMRTEQFGRPVL